jgi:signal peptidase I
VGVEGISMMPTLLNGDRVFVPKYETWLVRFGLLHWKPGEIVIVRPPAGTPNAYARFPVLGFPFRAYFIKRIVATPGDTLSIRQGQLYVNGVRVNENFLFRQLPQVASEVGRPFDPTNPTYATDYDFPGVCTQGGREVGIITQQGYFPLSQLPSYLKTMASMIEPPSSADPPYPVNEGFGLGLAQAPGVSCVIGTLKLRPGYYFVMGDDRTFGGSEDSRTFGPIPLDAIAGRATAVWWPPVVNGKLNWKLLEIPKSFLQLSRPGS